MSIQQFKYKYFRDNFYWINRNNFDVIQKIGLEMGCLLHTGKRDIVDWHDGFNCLGFRTYKEISNVTLFQKEAFLLYNQKATDFNEMINEYNKLKI